MPRGHFELSYVRMLGMAKWLLLVCLLFNLFISVLKHFVLITYAMECTVVSLFLVHHISTVHQFSCVFHPCLVPHLNNFYGKLHVYIAVSEATGYVVDNEVQFRLNRHHTNPHFHQHI